jgi:hypothetical protein
MAEDPLGPGVPHADDPVAVGCHHGIRGGCKDSLGHQSGQIHFGLLCYPMVIWARPPSTAPYAACPARVVSGVR